MSSVVFSFLQLIHRAQAYCDLCAKLNNPRQPKKTYNDYYQWWVEDSHCFHLSDKFQLANASPGGGPVHLGMG